MTEERLTYLAQWLETSSVDAALALPSTNITNYAAMQEAIGELVAEVRRLRGVLEEIAEIEPDEKEDGTILGYLAHNAEEMAEIAENALHAATALRSL